MRRTKLGEAPLRSPRDALLVALALYAAWTGATYLLEGRIETLLRPEAAGDRALYVLVANLLIGTVAALYFLRRAVLAGLVVPSAAGFGATRRVLIAVPAGLALGFAAYALQGPPSLEPVVLLNGFAQVLAVSAAEVLVCWAVVGVSAEILLKPMGRLVARMGAIALSAALFGAYHLAHSPPFDTLEMVLLLTAVGAVTGLFFVVSRDVYGTIAFHNFLGVLGVLRSLERAGQLESYSALQPPLLITATVSILMIVALHRVWLRRAPARAEIAGE